MANPNVIVFCSDEHARSYTGCYGNSIVQSPTIDLLSDRGSTFDRAFSPSPICVPARASLATGLEVHEHRCWSSAEPYHGQYESWMHRLRDQGHAVISFGKLHFQSSDEDNGFTEEVLPMHATNDGLGWPQGLLRNPLPPFEETCELAEHVGRGESDYTEYDRRITAAACEWLRKYPGKIKNRSWVLFISLVSPHYPLTAPAPFYDLYQHSEIGLPKYPQSRDSLEHPVLREIRNFWDYDDYFDDDLRIEAKRCYFGLISFLDDNIRQVLQALEHSNSASETVILYSSDHGEMLGHLGFWTKSVMYEDSVGIPLIACGPGFRRKRVQTPVSLTDIGATIEHALAIKQHSNKSWSSTPLQEIASHDLSDRFIISEYHDGGTPVSFYMLRHGDWKYVYYAANNSPQLFNLSDDPAELNNLAIDADFSSSINSMHSRLLQVLDPEQTANLCAQDQAARIQELGGRDAIMNLMSFNHTPVA